MEKVEVPTLEEFTEAQPETAVEVKMESETGVANNIGTTLLNRIKEAVAKAFAGLDSSELTQEYLDITVTKSVNGGTPQTVSDVERVLEIGVGYDFPSLFLHAVLGSYGLAFGIFWISRSRRLF